MAYVNVGAYVNGKRPLTKKALKEALASAPDSVRFDTTSAFDGVRDIRPGDEFTETLQVTGPDPYAKRNWYASVNRVNGTVRIK